jgi:hypothetical protein
MAVNDTSLFTVGIVFLSILVVLFFIRTRRPDGSAGSAAPKQDNEVKEEKVPAFVH